MIKRGEKEFEWIDILKHTLSLPDLPPKKPPPAAPPVAAGAPPPPPIATFGDGLCGVYKLSVRFGSRGDGIIS